MWTKILNAVTAGAGTETGASAVEAAAAAGGRPQNNHISPSSPCQRVTFGGDAAAAHSRSDGDPFDEPLPAENGTTFLAPPPATSISGGRTPFRGNHNVDVDEGSSSKRNSAAIFARLWGECIGDDTCAAFARSEEEKTSTSAPGGGTENDDRTINTLHHPAPSSSSSPRLPQEQAASSPPHSSYHHHLGPWERLVSALRDDRGIDVSRLLSGHECFLLEREVTDWINRAQGRQRAGPGRGKGMAERLALAAGAALHNQKGAMSAAAAAATPERPRGGAASRDGARGGSDDETADDFGSTAMASTAAAVEEGHRGGIPNHSRRRLPAEDSHFPMVVVEEVASDKGDAVSRVPMATAGGESEGSGAGTAAVSRSQKKKSSDRPLDLLGVALDAHEVYICATCCQYLRARV